MEVGSVADWVGIVVTCLTIFLTIRFYSKDNRREAEIMHTWHKIDRNSKKGIRYLNVDDDSELTVWLVNTGKRKVLYNYKGIGIRKRRFVMIFEWISTRYIGFCKYKTFLSFKKESFYFEPDFFEEIYKMRDPGGGFIELDVDSISEPYTLLLDNIASYLYKFSKQHNFFRERIENGKSIAFYILFEEISGKIYKKKIYLIPGNSLYDKTLEKMESNSSF